MTLTSTTERPTRRWHPPEVRGQAIRRVGELTAAAGGNRYGVVPRVAREMGVSPSSVRNWLRQAESTRIDLLAARVLEAEPRPVPTVRPAPRAAPKPAPAGRLRRRLVPAARDLRRPMAFYLASRAIVLVTVLCATATRAGLVDRRSLVLWPAVPSSGRLLDGFSVWDAGWYLHIATHWYVGPPLTTSPLGGDMAFFPLFPCLVRAVSVMTGTSPLAGGCILTVFTGAAAVAGVWYVSRAVAGPAVADRAAALWCLFPGAFVLSLVYAEGLTVAGAALCIVALLRRRWVVAGLAAALAGATQPAGLVLIGCCGWAAVAAFRGRRDWRALAAPLLAPLGVIAYFGYLWARTGDPRAWFDSERLFWSQGHFGPYWTVVRPVAHFLHDPGAVWHNPGVWDNAVRVAGLAVVVALGWLLWRWRPPAVLWIWAGGTVAVALMSAPVGARPRFVFVAFPLTVALARRLPRPAFYATLLVEATLLVALTFATVTTLNIVP